MRVPIPVGTVSRRPGRRRSYQDEARRPARDASRLTRSSAARRRRHSPPRSPGRRHGGVHSGSVLVHSVGSSPAAQSDDHERPRGRHGCRHGRRQGRQLEQLAAAVQRHEHFAGRDRRRIVTRHARTERDAERERLSGCGLPLPENVPFGVTRSHRRGSVAFFDFIEIREVVGDGERVVLRRLGVAVCSMIRCARSMSASGGRSSARAAS